MYGEVKMKVYAFLMSVLDGGERLASRHGYIIAMETPGQDDVEYRKICCSCQKSELQFNGCPACSIFTVLTELIWLPVFFRFKSAI
jgi:hypothetical protein